MRASDAGRARERAPDGTLDAVVRRVRRTALRRAAGALALWLAVLAAAVLTGAWLLAGPGGWSVGSALPLALDAGLLAGAVAAAAWAHVWTRRRLDERHLAGAMDRAAGLARGSVLGALEVGRETPPGVSAGLSRRAAAGVLGALPGPDRLVEATAGGAARRWARRGTVVLFVSGALLGSLALAAPERAASAWSGLLRPGAVLAVPELPPLSVRPGPGELDRGAELVVRVGAPGRSTVRLRWQYQGDVTRSREADVVDGTARFDLGDLSAPVEFHAEAPDGARTPPVRITPLDPLLVTDLRVVFDYPDHTGRGSESFRREVPPLEVPAGTRVRIRGRASRTLGAAALGPEGAPADSTTVALAVDGRGFTGEWRPRSSGTYDWRLRDLEGRSAGEAPPPLALTVVPDSAPDIALLEPGRDTLLPLDRRQRLVIRARDDYGVATIELEAYRVTAFGRREEPVVQSLRAGGTRGVVARPLLDVSDWELLPGDEIRYRARAVDNGVRPQRTETREYVLRAPRRSEKSRAVQERMEETTRAVDSLREDAGRAAREARELERRGAERRGRAQARNDRSGAGGNRPRAGEESPSREASFETREDVRQAARERAELLERADSLRRALDELEASAREANADDPGLREDLAELRELMEQVADAEALSDAEELAERAREMEGRELEDALEALAEGQEELRRQLDRSLERFRRASAEQAFRATAQETRELSQEQEALADALRDGESEDGSEEASESESDAEARTAQAGDAAERQGEMARRTGELEERMGELQETLTRLGEQEARAGVESARERAGSARKSMSRSAGQQGQGASGQAGEAGEEAARELQEAADALDRARNQMAQRMDQAVEQALRRTANEALALARRQSELRDRMRGADADDAAGLRGDEADVLEGLRNLAGNVGGVAAMAPGVGRQVLDAVGDAAGSLGETLEAMENPGAGTSPAALSEQAIEALNRVALAAGSGVGQQAGGQSTAGGSRAMRQQVQALARQQGNLTDRTGALTPRRLGRRPSDRQLREVAGRQEAVARELQELARRQRQTVRDEQLLGDMGALSEQAADVAERLSGGRLDRETLERQERLFHRLLDAGRSLEKEEEARQRESRTAGDVVRDPVEPLSSEALGGVRFGLPEAAVLQSLSPAQRALVVRYFERLNRQPAGTDAPAGEAPPP